MTWQKDIDKDKEWAEPVWAGYNDRGNDRNGHMHVNPEGSFIRSDGLRGDYCSAPLNFSQDTCSDPPTYKKDQQDWGFDESDIVYSQQDWELRVMSQEIRERMQ